MLNSYAEAEAFNRFCNNRQKEQLNITIIFIGNSLTFHETDKNLGWHNANGMAASLEDKDYAHLVLKTLKISKEQAIIENFAEIEQKDIEESQTFQKLKDLLSMDASYLIFQLGDNISNDEQLNYFWKNMHLLSSFIRDQQVYFVSTWWEHEVKDSIIQEICQKYKGNYIYIGDIFKSEDNMDRKKQGYAHPGVDARPQDWGMQEIAKRIIQKIM